MNIKKRGFLNFPLGNKKGALELSVTAIVVLILAIVMLGLGLGFVRGMFGKVSSSFEEQINAEPEPPAASGSEPITLSRETIIAHAKDPVVLKVDVYNPTEKDWQGVIANISCSSSTLNLENANTNPKNILQGSSDTFSILFIIGKDSASGSYLCYAYNNVTMGNYTKDLTIKVIK